MPGLSRALIFGLLPLSVTFGQGVITTVAGREFLFQDDGRRAVEAQLGGAWHMTFDAQGNLYWAEPNLNQVMRMSPDGIITVVAGNGLPNFAGDNGLARAASLHQPLGVAVDAAGVVYITDSRNGRVRRVDRAGIITTFASGLRQPAGICIDRRGNLLVTERAAHRIRSIEPDGASSIIAGIGEAGFSGDGGPALQARFSEPDGLAADRDGNIYVIDLRRVRKIDPGGVITTIIGGGDQPIADGLPATQVRPVWTTGIALLGQVVYFSDQLGHRVYRLTPSGTLLSVAGNGVPGFSGDGAGGRQAMLSSPTGLAIDNAGNLLVADSGNSRIRRVTPSEIISTVAGRDVPIGDDGPAANARFRTPGGISLDTAGNLYIAETDAHRVRRVTPSGIIGAFAGTGLAGFSGDNGPAVRAQLSYVTATATDLRGNVYLADRLNGRIRRVDPAGNISTIATGTQTIGGLSVVNGPPAIATDRNGNVYWSNAGGNMVRTSRVIRYSPDGNLSVVAGEGTPGFSGDGGPAVSARIGFVVAIAVDAGGAVYLGDQMPRVRRIDRNGIITTIAGTGQEGHSGDGGPATQARLTEVTGLAFDQAGNLYIGTETRIRRVDPSGIITTYAGSGRAGYSGDGGSARSATFAGTRGMAVDSQGNLYFADYPNDRIRVIQAARGPSILLSQRGLTFTASAGGNTPATQSFNVVNGAEGSLNWNLATSVLGGVRNWISVNRNTGASPPGGAGPPVDVRADPTGLSPGVYYGQIDVSAPGAANSPQSVTVVLNLLRQGESAGVTVDPAGLLFTGIPGGPNPAAQSLRIVNSAGRPVPFGATASFGDRRAWFAASPASGTLAPGQVATVEVRPNIAGFETGVFNATLTFAFGNDLPTRLVPMALVLSPTGGAPQTAKSGRAADCSPRRLVPVFTTLGPRFTIATGYPNAIEVRVVDDCAASLADGAVTVTFSNGDPPLPLLSLRDGRWTGSWQSRGAGEVTLTAEARSAGDAIAGSVQITGGLSANANLPPGVAAGGVLSAASYGLGLPAVPGGIVSIFGSALADAPQAAAALPLRNSLGGTQVFLANRPLPLVFVSPNQINAIIPYDIPVNARQHLLVRRGTTQSLPESVEVQAAQPGIFTRDNSGRGDAIVIVAYPDGSQALAGPDNPVTAGDVIVIYATGLGDVDPRAVAGSGTPVTPLSNALAPVRLTIGGVEAQVLFAGLTPGFTGLYQINAVVPDGVEPGDAVLMVASQGNRTSPPVTVAVR